MTTTARDALDLAFRQSYLKEVDGRLGAAVPRPLPAGPRRPLARGAWSRIAAVPYPVTGFDAVEGDPLDTVLPVALGLLRHEPHNPYNPHAAIPSARCAFAVRAYVVRGGEVLAYVPARHELRLVGDGAPDGRHVCVVADPAAFPAGYHDLRVALALLEAGHAVANLVTAGRAAGLRSVVRAAGDELLPLLGLDPAGPVLAAAVVTFGTGGDLAPLLPGADPAPHLPVPPGGATTPAPEPRPPAGRLADVLWRRSAGRGVPGLSASLRPVPASALWRAAAEAARLDLVAGTEGPRGPVGWLRQFWVTERVDGVPDGVHEHVGDGIVTHRRGRFLARVQEGFSYPATQTAVETTNLVGLFAVDYPALMRAYGPAGFLAAQLRLGAAAQAASLALAAEGLFARPCRSFHEHVLDDLLGLTATETVGYELLCGRARFPDLLLDLRM
ncbi:MAG TPA: hypothetical protein VNA20_14070 [Frankiaceae bacterium]|nr:hypothetical protein [Frankiaceae bacterium]